MIHKSEKHYSKTLIIAAVTILAVVTEIMEVIVPAGVGILEKHLARVVIPIMEEEEHLI
jgi:hypothetical protein